jgi:hypothetical protein
VRAAQEDYAHRAYPAKDVPFTATKQAIAGYHRIAQSSTGPRAPVGAWQQVGPRGEDYPGVLTFFGQPYVASGRITALAIGNQCTLALCRVWVGAAGGGIWRTENALGSPGTQNWQFMSGSFGTNAIGTLTYTPSGVLYAGTGEPNASGDSEAGVGIYKSTNYGTTWTKLPSTTHTSSPANGNYSGDAFANRSIASIVVDPTNPNVIYVASTRGVRGVSSVTGNATSTPPPPRPPFGLYKSINGGQTFQFIWNGNGTIRGVNHVELDPYNHNVVYAAAFSQGIWRSDNGGGTFGKQLVQPLVSQDFDNAVRTEFALAKLSGGNTRMYVQNGASGPDAGEPESEVYRSDNANAASPTFIDLTNDRNSNVCTGQCWYDNIVVSPAGYPDMVYIGGSFDYSSYFASTDGRGVLLSTDAGNTWSDVTADATQHSTPPGNCCNPNPISPNAMHPDQHGLVVSPTNPGMFFEGSDGGLVRSSGSFADISNQCLDRPTSRLARCQELLSHVPTKIDFLNDGLATLQFQSLSVNPQNSEQVMGGTQDNGTMEGVKNFNHWPQIIYGDGGLSGWNAANSNLRFNSFYGQAHDANFRNGDPQSWVIIAGPIASSPEASNFYAPIIPDPRTDRAGSIFEGSQSVWRTTDWGGDQTYLENNCPEFFVAFNTPSCGDFQRLGKSGQTDLTGPAFGSDRQVCCVAALARAPSDTGTLWAATNGGRVFVTHNADNANPAGVQWKRLDSLVTNDPQRSITSIFVDPNNPNHAWISYTGYDFNTPTEPGHVFSVNANNGVSWTNLDGTGLADLPVTSVVFDSVTGDLYASTDFGVVRRAHGTSTWTVAGTGMPMGEVAGLTIVPNARKLYAAMHGLSAFRMQLP